MMYTTEDIVKSILYTYYILYNETTYLLFPQKRY